MKRRVSRKKQRQRDTAASSGGSTSGSHGPQRPLSPAHTAVEDARDVSPGERLGELRVHLKQNLNAQAEHGEPLGLPAVARWAAHSSPSERSPVRSVRLTGWMIVHSP